MEELLSGKAGHLGRQCVLVKVIHHDLAGGWGPGGRLGGAVRDGDRQGGWGLQLGCQGRRLVGWADQGGLDWRHIDGRQGVDVLAKPWGRHHLTQAHI